MASAVGLDSSSSYHYRRHLKRSHSRMEGESSFLRDLSATPPLATLGRTQPRFPRTAADYPGGGMDFRRPAMSTSQGTSQPFVIDLTGSDDAEPEGEPSRSRAPDQPRPAPTSPRPARRLPRYSREIIDLEDAAPDPPRQQPQQGRNSQGSPDDVQFILSRPRSLPRPPPQFPPIQQRAAPQIHPTRGFALFGHTVQNGEIERMRSNFPRQLGYIERIARHIGYGAIMPRMFDYTQPSFDLGTDERQPSEPRTSPVVHDALPPVREGFTRSPDENTVLICPNCEEELCAGGDEVKQQVWVVKLCGHVYCGQCTQNRHATKSKKGKAPARDMLLGGPAPFTHCVVEGCTSQVKSKPSMVQLFL